MLQTIYAQLSAGESNITAARKSLDHNLNRLNELAALQLAALREVVKAGRLVIAEGLNKHLPTQEDLNPSYAIVDNPFLTALLQNFDYQQQTEKYQFPWELHDDVMRKMYLSFRKGPKFSEYLAIDEPTGDDHQRMVLNLFKHIINTEDFRDLFFDRSLLWEDDFDQIAQHNYAILKALDPFLLDASTPLRTMVDERDESDMEALRFAHQLLAEALSHVPENEKLIRNHLKNWDFDRVALMDIIIINMGIAELTACPSIPERVTVDECIELSKEFSSDKSKIFVNGIIDKIILDLRSAGRINKSGRGLYIPGLDDEEEDAQ